MYHYLRHMKYVWYIFPNISYHAVGTKESMSFKKCLSVFENKLLCEVSVWIYFLIFNWKLLFFKKIYLFIYFWLHLVFVAARGLSLVAVSGGFSLLWCAGFSLWWLLLLQSMGSRHVGSVVVAHELSSCGSWAQERRLSSCGTRA